MSKYFQIFSRLEKKDTAGSGAESPTAGEPAGLDADSPGLPREVVAFPEQPVAEHDAALAALLDSLRARVTVSDLPCVVVAGVTAEESVDGVLSGLANQAERQGLNLLLGELTVSKSGRVLRSLGGDGTLAGDETLTSVVQQSLDCGGKPFFEILMKWSEQTGANHDLLIIGAPPLLSSVETALIAKAGHGLVLVVRPFLTPRAALRSAVEKAATAGCNIIGIVMEGTKRQFPRWLGRLIGI